MKKTVVIWDTLDAYLQFFITDKDVEKFHNKYLNDSMLSSADEQELSKLVYEENGDFAVTMLDEFPVKAVREGASVIISGVLP